MKKILSILIFGLFAHLASAQIFDVDTIQYTGSIDNRINLVILGDGYQSSEQSKFLNDANKFSNAFFSEVPYAVYQNYFNVFVIKVPSNESGASHPRTGPDNHDFPDLQPLLVVDNYFGSTFDFNDIHRLLIPVNTSAITNVLASNFPSYDQVIILVNSPYYGGSGGDFAALSTHEQSNELALHELGHSFADLADEYYAGDYWAKEKINMTQVRDPKTVKWKNWMFYNGIGIYRHCCGGNSSIWFRPHEDCKMFSLYGQFCSVCIEGIIEKIHSFVSPIDSFFPLNEEILNLSNPTIFSLNLNKPNPNTLNIEWSLNGNIINSNVETVFIDPENLVPGSNQIQAIIEDRTTLLRIGNHETVHIYSVLWTIDSGTLSIVDISEEHLNFEIFPNPTMDILNIKLNKKIEEKLIINIFNITGQELTTNTLYKGTDTISLNLTSFSSGIYIIKFQFGNGLVLSRKIIKS